MGQGCRDLARPGGIGVARAVRCALSAWSDVSAISKTTHWGSKPIGEHVESGTLQVAKRAVTPVDGHQGRFARSANLWPTPLDQSRSVATKCRSRPSLCDPDPIALPAGLME